MQRFYINAIGAGGPGSGGSGSPSGCGGVASITWETPLESFLKASTVSSLVDEANNCSLKNLNSDVIAVIQGEQGKGLSSEAFQYNGESPLYDRSQNLIDTMSQIDESVFSQVVEGIQSAGDQHRYEEAWTSYTKRLEEYQRRYNEELCPAVDKYNSNVVAYNAGETSKHAKDPRYSPKVAYSISVSASPDSAPVMNGTINSNVTGAAELKNAFDDCTKFYNVYVVPAKELHNECSKSEYVSPQPIPDYEFPNYPKTLAESAGQVIGTVGNFLLSIPATLGQGICVLADGAIHLGEMIYDGVSWVGSHTIGGLIGGLGSLFSGNGFMSGYKAVTEHSNQQIAVDHSGNIREWFYNTSLGQAIDNHAWFRHDSAPFNVLSTITTYTLPIVAATALTVVTGGATSPLLATVGGTAATNISIALGLTGVAMGTGEAAESVYQQTGGKDTLLGTAKIIGSGALNGISYFIAGNTIVPNVASSIRPGPRHMAPSTTSTTSSTPRHMSPNSSTTTTGSTPQHMAPNSSTTTTGSTPQHMAPSSSTTTTGSTPQHMAPSSSTTTTGSTPQHMAPSSSTTTTGSTPQHMAPSSSTTTTGSTPQHMAPSSSTTTTTSTTSTTGSTSTSLPDPDNSTFFDTPPEEWNFPNDPTGIDEWLDFWDELIQRHIGGGA